jgi:hypothetical protein
MLTAGRARGRVHEELMDTALILQHPARSHLFEDPLWLWRHSNSSASMPVAWTSMVRQSYGGRVNPRCGDPDRRAGVLRLMVACATARRDAEPVLGPSDFSTAPCGVAQVHEANGWREGQPEMR